MLSRVQYIVLTATAAVLLVVTGTDVAVYMSNVAIQKEFSANNQYLQQTVQRQSLYQEMLRTMADMASGRNDEQMKELLAKHGVTVAAQPAPAAQAKGDARPAPGSSAVSQPGSRPAAGAAVKPEGAH